MSRYTGSKCISCGVPFFEGDDVVVCPDCGTPYHRACYDKLGQCINDRLHQSGEAWQPETETPAPAAETVRCVRCGAENPADKQFCGNCGTPLMNNAAQNGFDPFAGADTMGFMQERQVFNQDSVVDGVRLGDYAIYIGKNPLRFLPNFIRFSKFGAKLSLNLAAFLVPSLYFLYRKMKAWGILLLIVTALLGIPDMIYYLATNTSGMTIDLGIDLKSQMFIYIYNGTSIANMLVQIAAGVFANYLYYVQAKRDIEALRSQQDGDEDQTRIAISRKGGVSWGNVIVGFLARAMITMGAIVLIGKLV